MIIVKGRMEADCEDLVNDTVTVMDSPTSYCSTGGQRLDRCCHLLNNVEYIYHVHTHTVLLHTMLTMLINQIRNLLTANLIPCQCTLVPQQQRRDLLDYGSQKLD